MQIRGNFAADALDQKVIYDIEFYMALESKMSQRRRLAMTDAGEEYCNKRRELVQIAARLFKEKGYAATYLIDIANEAGLDRASVYYYIKSKEELLQESIEAMLTANLTQTKAIIARSDIAVSKKLTEIMKLLMLSYEANYPQLYVYMQEQMHQVSNNSSPWAKAMMKKTKDHEVVVRKLLSEGVERGEIRDDISVRVAANALFGMFNWTHRWFNPEGMLNGHAIALAFCSIFLEGMGTAPAKRPRKPSTRNT